MKINLLPTLAAIGSLLFSTLLVAQNEAVRCDTMFLRDSSMRLVQQISLTNSTVKFLRCPPDSLIWTVKKSSLLKIRMANGGRLDFPEIPGSTFEKPGILETKFKEQLRIEASIEEYRSRRRNSGFGGLAVGGLIGLIAGAAIAQANYEDPCANKSGFCLGFGSGLDRFFGGTIGLLIGGGLGAGIGFASIKVPLDGSRQRR